MIEETHPFEFRIAQHDLERDNLTNIITEMRDSQLFADGVADLKKLSANGWDWDWDWEMVAVESVAGIPYLVVTGEVRLSK